MPTDPTTKSQVQAYRFMLRRMENALVRRDAVMAHEPMRNHLTATAVGLIVGVLGLAAFFVVGMFSPTSQVRPGDLVISKKSSAVYVVQDQPRRLVPVLNLASARLLVAAFTGPGSEPPETKWVEESALDGINRAPITGLIGAPPTLPSPQDLVPGPWSVCDTADGTGDTGTARAAPTTTALLGTGAPGTPLGDGEALLVQTPDASRTYLVHGGRRSEVDPADAAVRNTYRLDTAVVRKAGLGLLNAIPEARPLTAPDIPGAGGPSPFPQLGGTQVGDVVRVEVSEDQFFLVLAQGKQRVSPAVADLIRYDRGKKELATVAPEDIARVPDAPAAARPDFGDFPAQVPRLLDAEESRNTCLTWTGQDRGPVVTASPEDRLPLGSGRSATEVPGAGSGLVADRVFVEPGRGALARSVVLGQDPASGYLWLVTEHGLRYRVPTMDVARSLGLGERATPAPEAVLGLLPIGPELDPQRALELYDPVLAREQQGGG